MIIMNLDITEAKEISKYFIENVDEYLAEVREIVNALSIPFTNRKTSL